MYQIARDVSDYPRCTRLPVMYQITRDVSDYPWCIRLPWTFPMTPGSNILVPFRTLSKLGRCFPSTWSAPVHGQVVGHL